MSFILDALRKSDQQRQRGAAPTLLTAPVPAAESKKPAYWTQGLIAAVLVCAGVAVGWLRPWQPAQPPVRSQPIAPVTAAAPAPRPAVLVPLPALPAASTAPAQVTPPQKPAAAPASSGAAATQDRVPSPSGAQARSTPQNPAAAAPTEPPPAAEKSAGAADAAAEPKAIAMSELPAAIRQELPAMQVLLHQYSPRPANRFVTINSQTLQEGESVAPGLTLEQITRDGMILSYRGFRFRRGVP